MKFSICFFILFLCVGCGSKVEIHSPSSGSESSSSQHSNSVEPNPSAEEYFEKPVSQKALDEINASAQESRRIQESRSFPDSRKQAEQSAKALDARRSMEEKR